MKNMNMNKTILFLDEFLDGVTSDQRRITMLSNERDRIALARDFVVEKKKIAKE